ncbi:MAG: CBS domain-containing protein [Acidobacteriia bacterium]|nr:CBS domain-containing protein [Terriglobia bacterium]
MARVRDLLHNRILFHAEENDAVADVARQMAQLHIGAILVLDGGRLCGVFSERDLMKRVVLERLNPESTPVKFVMSTDVVTVDEDAELQEAMEAMEAHSCRHLPVMRGGRVTGFLSMRDIMHYELTRQTDEIHHMRAYIHGA